MSTKPDPPDEEVVTVQRPDKDAPTLDGVVLSRLSTTLIENIPQEQGPAVDRPEPLRALHLVVLSGPAVGQVFTLDAEARPVARWVIGRDEAAELRIDDSGVSRKHAQIVWDAARRMHLLHDMKSANGTRVNDLRISGGGYELHRGDKIALGARTVLRVSQEDEEETRYALRMRQELMHDGLTGAYNRRYLDDRLTSEISAATRHQRPLSLLLLDIDHFKAVNDTHGHPAGDEILRQFAATIMEVCRAEDVLIRYGGEEFAVLCCNTDDPSAARFAERIRAAVAAEPYRVGEKSIPVTVSIGVVSLADTDSEDHQVLINAADWALYKAKASGRDRVVRFSEAGLDRSVTASSPPWLFAPGAEGEIVVADDADEDGE